MKQILSIKKAMTIVLMILLIASCSSPKGLVFADREWHVSDYYGQIIDKDTTYRMTFGNILIPDPLVIVSSADSVANYHGMDRFIADILHTASLDSAEILFYAPEMMTMFVRPKGAMPHQRPSSISSPMSDERPYTIWVNDDDIEDWHRKPSEMYTYTYIDKRKRQLLIVDVYNYGDTPIAQIKIFQSHNKATSGMNIPETHRQSFFYHDFGKRMHHHIEALAHSIEMRRAQAFANYKIGQEQKLRKR